MPMIIPQIPKFQPGIIPKFDPMKYFPKFTPTPTPTTVPTTTYVPYPVSYPSVKAPAPQPTIVTVPAAPVEIPTWVYAEAIGAVAIIGLAIILKK